MPTLGLQASVGVMFISVCWICVHCFARADSLRVDSNCRTIFWTAGSFQLVSNPWNPLVQLARKSAYSSGTVRSLVNDAKGKTMSYFRVNQLFVTVAVSSSTSLTLIPIAPNSCCRASASCL